MSFLYEDGVSQARSYFREMWGNRQMREGKAHSRSLGFARDDKGGGALP
jgi:hypothetical protein